MNTATINPTVSVKRTISKTRRNVGVASLVMQLHEARTALENMKKELTTRFMTLHTEVLAMQQADPSFKAPWEGVLSFAPASDQRVYQVKNCKDAILKVLRCGKKNSVSSKEIVTQIHALGLTYSEGTIRCQLSYLVSNYLSEEDQYADPSGFKLAMEYQGPRLGGSRFWKAI